MILCRSAAAVLVLEGERVTLGERVATLAELTSGTLDTDLLQCFGLIPFTEAIARAVLARDGRTLSDEEMPYRPSARRLFGGGRGGTWVVWILGRRVRASAGKLDYEERFETFATDQFPPALAAAIGPAGVADVTAAVLTLMPFECMCGTGADTIDQHGEYETFAHKQDTGAPIDFNATAARCTICNRGWTYEESGDPAYEMHYQATRFLQRVE